jgi:hypothetical protein
MRCCLCICTLQTGPRRAKDAQLYREAVSRSIALAAAAVGSTDSVQSAAQRITNSQKARWQQQAQLSKQTAVILAQSSSATDASTLMLTTGLPPSHPAVQLHQVMYNPTYYVLVCASFASTVLVVHNVY